RWHHRQGARRVAAIPDRFDSARARDERGKRELTTERRGLRPGPRLRHAAAGPTARGDERRRQRRGSSRARRRPRDGRERLTVPMTARAVFFDVDFTLIATGL